MIKFIKQIANLWRIRKNATAYEKGLLRHLSVKPIVRDEIKKFHDIKPMGFNIKHAREGLARLARASRRTDIGQG